MFRNYRFAALIALVSTLIFYFSPHWSESFRPRQTTDQVFVEAKVVEMISSQLVPDTRAPYIWTGRQVAMAEILEGEEKGKLVKVDNPLSRQHNVLLNEGCTFIMMIRQTADGPHYWAYNHKRSTALYSLVAGFLLLLFAFGRKEGFNSIISLYFTAALVIGVLIPSIFAGWHPLIVTTVLMAIMIVVNFILVAGYNRKSFAAMAGTLLGVIAAGILAQGFGEWARLSGVYLDHGETVLYLTSREIPVRWLMFVAIMISALGAVMDVAISIASAYNELQTTNPELTPKQLMLASMNIGRDIMGTMTNTLILAIAGSSLSTIMMVWGLGMPVGQFMNMPLTAMNLIHGLAGSVGIVLTIPFTAWLSYYIIKPEVHKIDQSEATVVL